MRFHGRNGERASGQTSFPCLLRSSLGRFVLRSVAAAERLVAAKFFERGRGAGKNSSRQRVEPKGRPWFRNAGGAPRAKEQTRSREKDTWKVEMHFRHASQALRRPPRARSRGPRVRRPAPTGMRTSSGTAVAALATERLHTAGSPRFFLAIASARNRGLSNEQDL